MSERTARLPHNVVGPFYVDDTCTDCDLCREMAPAIFARHDESAYSYVYRQPVTAEEQAQALAARDACPMEAIGEDGERAFPPA